jgi:hypothetical protein
MTSQPAAVPVPSSGDRPAIRPPASARARAIRRTLTASAIRAGNSHALRHGVYSEVAVREDVLDEAALLYARAEWLDPIRHGHLVEATARLVVRLRKLDQALDAEPSSMVLSTMASRLEAQLTRNLGELCLSPRSAADAGIGPREDTKAHAARLSQETLARYQQPPAPAGQPIQEEQDDAD